MGTDGRLTGMGLLAVGDQTYPVTYELTLGSEGRQADGSIDGVPLGLLQCAADVPNLVLHLSDGRRAQVLITKVGDVWAEVVLLDDLVAPSSDGEGAA